MDYTYRERHGEAIYRFKDGTLPSDFFRRNVVLSFQEDASACATSLAKARRQSRRMQGVPVMQTGIALIRHRTN